MSSHELTIWLENKAEEFETILANKEWDKVQPFCRAMEQEGAGDYVKEISELMTEEDVAEYKEWDEETNGSTETQMI